MLDPSGLSATITRRFRGRVHRSDLGVPHGPQLGLLLSLRLSFEGKCHRWVNRFDPQVCRPDTPDEEKLQVSEVQIRRSLYLETATSRPVVTSQLPVTALVTVLQASAPPPGPPGRMTDHDIATPSARFEPAPPNARPCGEFLERLRSGATCTTSDPSHATKGTTRSSATWFALVLTVPQVHSSAWARHAP